MQKALTVYVRDGETTTLKNGRRIITPPALVGELDCYNNDCKIFMCNKETGMARVVSASLFIYRKINNGSSVRHEYVGKYDINAKGNTFSVELVEESSKLDTSFIESRMTEEGVDPKLYEVCKGIKQMLSKHTLIQLMRILHSMYMKPTAL